LLIIFNFSLVWPDSFPSSDEHFNRKQTPNPSQLTEYQSKKKKKPLKPILRVQR